MPEAPLLRTEALTRAFGSLIAVDRVDVAVRRGELRSIIGPNGAGKTTFFRLISGETTPTSGRVWFGGREITGLPQHAVARLGITKSYQITNVFPHLTVHENVRVAVQGWARSFNFWSRADALTDVAERAHALLRTVGLAAKSAQLAAHLAHGEKRHLELAVAEGEVVGLIGRNGAGKTTTLRSVMGLARPARGRVRLRGEDLTRLPTHEIVRRGIAWIPEERRVLPNLTVLENLKLGMLGVGTSEAEAGSRLEDVFRHFPRLRERVDHRGQFLSGGEQQMVAIARALVARPTVMLVDEPMEGLAPMLVQNLTEILAAINRGGTTILLVEHTLEVALALSRLVYVMDQGRIQFQGTPDELRKDPTIQQRFLEV